MLALLLALALSLTLRRMPDSEGARLWALAFLPLAAGLVLQQVEVDATLVLVLRDPLVLAGFALLLAGLRQVLQLPRIWLLSGSIVLASLVASFFFTTVWPLPELRQALRLTGVTLLCLGCVTVLRELREPLARRVGLFLQGVFATLVMLTVLRLALLLPERSPFLAALEGTARVVQAALLLAALLGLVLLLAARMNVTLVRLVVRDPLTGVLNRRGLDEAAHTTLGFARRVGRPVGLLLCEPDPLAAGNERQGAAQGDEVLGHFAALLDRQFEGADLAGRLGGGQFAVLLPGAGPEEALQAAETLREDFAAQPLLVGGEPVSLSVSIGVVSLPATELAWAGLLAHADVALHEAKACGRNACVLSRSPREPEALPPPDPAGVQP